MKRAMLILLSALLVLTVGIGAYAEEIPNDVEVLEPVVQEPVKDGFNVVVGYVFVKDFYGDYSVLGDNLTFRLLDSTGAEISTVTKGYGDLVDGFMSVKFDYATYEKGET